MSVSIDCGKYLAAFEYVTPGQVEKLPYFVAISQVCLIRKLADACRYLMSASMIGISYALNADRVACFLFGLGCVRAVVLGRKGKRHNFS